MFTTNKKNESQEKRNESYNFSFPLIVNRFPLSVNKENYRSLFLRIIMNRRKFIKNSCISCMGLLAGISLIESCSPAKMIHSPINGSDIIVELKDFENIHKGQKQYLPYLIIENDQLKYPICLYRINETTYSAVWMCCTHQGATLQVFGDKLQCPAHGSEFNQLGEVLNTPATERLRKFPVNIHQNQLFISLK